MFVQPRGTGWVEVICGPMFSGKTEELIRRLRRAQIARQRVEVFKPTIDNRYSASEVVSHNDRRTGAVPVKSSMEMLERIAPRTEVVAVDETQFFDDKILDVIDHLAGQGRRVVVAGLDTDYRGEPFEPMPTLIARAEYVTKLLAICVRCGSPANRTLRTAGGESRVEVGEKEAYEAVCRGCHRMAYVAPAVAVEAREEVSVFA